MKHSRFILEYIFNSTNYRCQVKNDIRLAKIFISRIDFLKVDLNELYPRIVGYILTKPTLEII